MPPTSMSARAKDKPRVLSPGKLVGFAETTARPVFEKFSEAFVSPEKTKSSVMTSEEFLHGRM